MQIKRDWTHLEADIISVFAKTPVQIVNNALESRPFTCVCLIVHHSLQHLFVTPRHQT